MSGDDMLNSTSRRLWELHQHIFWKWGTYCIFKHSDIDVPRGIPELITFMIPKDATHRYEIEEFVKNELEGFKDKPIKSDLVNWPGTEANVIVTEFSGVQPYTDKETIDRITKEGMKLFRQMLKDMKKEGDKDV